jgi:hypothetical protein
MTAPVPTEADERRVIARFRTQWQSKYPELRALVLLSNEQRFARAHTDNSYLYWRGMQAQGYQSGVPDYVLPVARRGFFSLWIELKRLRGSTTSPEQKRWCQVLANLGHAVLIGKGSTVVCETLLWYLQGEPTIPMPVGDRSVGPGNLVPRETRERWVE